MITGNAVSVPHCTQNVSSTNHRTTQYAPSQSKPAELKVNFPFSNSGSLLDGNYWIIRLGPVVNDLYDYAIVSDAISFYLLVYIHPHHSNSHLVPIFI